MAAVLQSPIFTDENEARKALEAVRWPNGPVCPHCGATDRLVKLEGTKKSHRAGLLFCNHCQGQFTVTVGTVFERSHVPLTKWWIAVYLLCSSKKGISSHQLHRTLGVAYRTAWFMTHRIREAMRDGTLAPMGGQGKTVEADETYIGRNSKPRVNKRGGAHKNKVVGLVERRGKARTVHVDRVTSDNIRDILVSNADRKSALMTDEASWYIKAGKEFTSHESVNHRAEEYVRGEAHTNTIEGYFSIFKRGMKGIYQHCSEQHLHRYLSEFDFRYNHRIALGVNDWQRTVAALAGIEGKRLTYRRAN
jgi:transposase-like protein